MMDVLNELQTIGLTALFNPTFLFLLIVLFFLGRLVGWMTRSINVWKFLAIAYFGIFVFRPLQDAGVVIGGVFILGVSSMYLDLFKGIFGWSSNIGDVIFAFRNRSAYNEIDRLEREVEALKGQLRSSQPSASASGGSGPQASWRAQSQARKNKTKDGSGSSRGSRDGGSGSTSSRGTKPRQSAKPRGTSGGRSRTGSKSSGGSKAHASSSRSSSYKAQSRVADGPDGQQKPQSKKKTTRVKPNASGASQSSQSRSKGRSQSSSQSQSSQQSKSNQNQSGTQQNQQNTSGASTAPMSSALRDKYLATLELVPGQSYSEREIKDAWRKMAFKTHPDRGGSAAAFAEAFAAYKALR